MSKRIPPQYLGKTFAVVSDIHANYQALREVDRVIDSQRVDYVVMLGDLLTYGCDVEETLYLVDDIANKHQTFFVKGNHDQCYFDMQNKPTDELPDVPSFISASMEYNYKRLLSSLEHRFPWRENISIGNIYFSHANPYPYGDWTYLNTEPEILAAARQLSTMNFRFGVFGHTHRARLALLTAGQIEYSLKGAFSHSINQASGNNVQAIMNPGSCGQPRGEQSSFLILKPTEQSLDVDCIEFEYDVDAHVRSINASDLSDEVKDKLISYFQ